MTEKKNVTAPKKPKGRVWNFPQLGVSITASSLKEATAKLKELKKKPHNSLKS